MSRLAPLSVALTLVLASVATGADIITDVVDPYLRIQTALADDSLAPIRANAATIAAASTKLGPEGKPLAAAATDLGSAASMDAARAAFGRLSVALIEYSERTRSSLGDEVHVAYCPMEKKSWVQKGKAIVNPYGGKQMKSCGEIVKGTR